MDEFILFMLEVVQIEDYWFMQDGVQRCVTNKIYLLTSV